MTESLANKIKERLEARKKQLNQHRSFNEPKDVSQVAELIRKSMNITVLTGAGISTMSGIPDYRSAVEGVWRKKPDILESLNQHVFMTNPKEFWNSYYELFVLSLADLIPHATNEAVVTAIDLIEPNEGHRFFAFLEEMGKDVTIITQNVDGLHQKGGSKRVLEIHGNVTTCSCPLCHESYELKEVFNLGNVPTCLRCGTPLRPNVVFFGDMVKEFQSAGEALSTSDLVIVVGTSLNVAPFNQLPELASSYKIPIVYINEDISSTNGTRFDFTLQGDISEICNLLRKKL